MIFWIFDFSQNVLESVLRVKTLILGKNNFSHMGLVNRFTAGKFSKMTKKSLKRIFIYLYFFCHYVILWPKTKDKLVLGTEWVNVQIKFSKIGKNYTNDGFQLKQLPTLCPHPKPPLSNMSQPLVILIRCYFPVSSSNKRAEQFVGVRCSAVNKTQTVRGYSSDPTVGHRYQQSQINQNQSIKSI